MVPAFVINVPRRTDRMAAFTARATAAKLWVEPIPGRERGPVPRRWQGSAQSFYNAEAHERALRSSRGVVAVFEDDAVVEPDLLPRIEQALAAAPAGWELILLGAQVRGYGEQWRAPLHQVSAFAYTHAYLVSDAGRPLMLEAIAAAVRHWDHELSRRLGHRGRTWLLCPPLRQDPGLGSDIPDSRRRR